GDLVAGHRGVVVPVRHDQAVRLRRPVGVGDRAGPAGGPDPPRGRRVPLRGAPPNAPEPRKPRAVPEPDRSMVCPSAITSSGVPTAAGQVNVVPPNVAWPPAMSGGGV